MHKGRSEMFWSKMFRLVRLSSTEKKILADGYVESEVRETSARIRRIGVCCPQLFDLNVSVCSLCLDVDVSTIGALWTCYGDRSCFVVVKAGGNAREDGARSAPTEQRARTRRVGDADDGALIGSRELRVRICKVGQRAADFQPPVPLGFISARTDDESHLVHRRNLAQVNLPPRIRAGVRLRRATKCQAIDAFRCHRSTVLGIRVGGGLRRRFPDQRARVEKRVAQISLQLVEVENAARAYEQRGRLFTPQQWTRLNSRLVCF